MAVSDVDSVKLGVLTIYLYLRAYTQYEKWPFVDNKMITMHTHTHQYKNEDVTFLAHYQTAKTAHTWVIKAMFT